MAARSTKRSIAIFLFATLIIPLVGFALLGERFEQQIADAVLAIQSPLAVGLAIAAALSADLFLPIPSSVVLTYGGQVIGVAGTTLAGTIGLTISAECGYWLARVGGRPLAIRFAGEDDVRQFELRTNRNMTWWLIVTRPLPLIAEAATLTAGLAKLPHLPFFIAVTIANTWVSIVFATLGSVGGEAYQWPVLIASAVVPLGLTMLLRRRDAERSDRDTENEALE